VSDDQEILSAELLFSQSEVLAEFQQRCEEAAERPGRTSDKLQAATAALCRMLDRQGKVGEK